MSKRRSNADAHFEDLFGARKGESLTNNLKLIPRDNIERLAQPRVSFPEAELNDLADSIRDLHAREEGIEATGILQPLLVTENASDTWPQYRLIAGERRFRASELVGLENLPCLVVQMQADTIRIAQLVENMQRENLAPLEEAKAIQTLMQEQHLSLREVAKALGKGKGYVENRLALLKMGTDVQDMVSAKASTLLHAREIDSVPDASTRALLIEAVLNEGLSRSLLRERIEHGASTSARVSVQTDSQSAARKKAQGSDTGPSVSLKSVVESTRRLRQQLPVLVADTSYSSEARQALDLEVQELKALVLEIENLLHPQ